MADNIVRLADEFGFGVAGGFAEGIARLDDVAGRVGLRHQHVAVAEHMLGI